MRECIGCNACYSRSVWGLHLGCTQNPTAGRSTAAAGIPSGSTARPTPTTAVLVVGAGPAGMECAMVLGKRGFELVHLADAGDDIGGAMRWVTRLPGLGEWGRVVDYRRIQLDRLAERRARPGRALDAEAVRDYGAEIVVVATGARWTGDGMNGITRAPIPGADAALPHVLLPEDVMVAGARPEGRRVAILDCEGYFTGPGIAEVLRAEGYRGDLRDAATTSSRPPATRRSKAFGCAFTCTCWGSTCARDSPRPRSSPAGSAPRTAWGGPSRSRPTRACW